MAQRGIALLAVLWACTLLAILLGGYAATARIEGLLAHYQFEKTRAHYAAEAGLMRGVYALRVPDRSKLWFRDGRPYAIRFDGARVQVSITDETGKIDINSARPDILRSLFRGVGESFDHAVALTHAIVEWRSPAPGTWSKDQLNDAYVAAGRSYGPRNGPFVSVEELQMVLGITPVLYAKIAPLVTIWSGMSEPNIAAAPPAVLAVLPGWTPERVREVLAERAGHANNGPLPDFNYRKTYTICAIATLDDGTRAVLRAVVQPRLAWPDRRHFVVLRWQEGSAQ